MEQKLVIIAQKIPSSLLYMKHTSQREFDTYEADLICDYEVSVRSGEVILDVKSILLFDEYGNMIVPANLDIKDFKTLLDLITKDIDNRAHDIIESYYEGKELDKAEPENHREF